MKLKIKFDTEVAALLVAFVAVAMAAWDGYESRNYNRKSVMPIFNAYVDKNFGQDRSEYKIGITGVGLGPAKVTGFHVFFNGKIQAPLELPGYASSYPSTNAIMSGGISDLNEKYAQDWSLSTSDNSLSLGRVLAKDAYVTLLRYNSGIPQKEFRQLMAAVEETTDIFVCYCSIYDDQCNIVHIGKHEELQPQSCLIDEVS